MAGMENLYRGAILEKETDPYERRRDFYFRALIQSKLIDTFRSSLEEAHFTHQAIDELTGELALLPEEDARTVLALPFEIRERLLARYHEQMQKGTIDSAGLLKDLLQKNRRHGYTLGYHIANTPILKTNNGERIEWNVRGNELDDRDNMRMAYYSEDYLSRYKKKNGQFLYVVRAETGDSSSHKRDLKNRWGRAPFLSIIDEYSLPEIEHEIDEAIKKESVVHEVRDDAHAP